MLAYVIPVRTDLCNVAERGRGKAVTIVALVSLRIQIIQNNRGDCLESLSLHKIFTSGENKFTLTDA